MRTRAEGRLGAQLVAIGVASAPALLILWTAVFLAASALPAPVVAPRPVALGELTEVGPVVEPTSGYIWCVQQSPTDPTVPSSPDLCPDLPARPPQTVPTRLHIPVVMAERSFGSPPPQLATEVIGPGRNPDLRCRADVSSLNCGAIFPIGSTSFRPGAVETRVVTIHNRGGAARTVGLYLANFVARAPMSELFCTASDPSDQIVLEIAFGDTVIYPRPGDRGTLAEFAARHGHVSTPLWAPVTARWQTEQRAEVTIRVGLDRSADNRYQGCVTTADLWWVTP